VNLSVLEKLDRRWLFLLMGLLTWPAAPALGLALGSSLAGQAVPGRGRGHSQRLHRAHCRATTTRAQAGNGPDDPNRSATSSTSMPRGDHLPVARRLRLVDETIEKVAAEYAANGHTLVYGKDYVDLGYKAGNEAVMVLMGTGIAAAFPRINAPPSPRLCRSCGTSATTRASPCS